VAPAAYHHLAHSEAELATARAAAKAGVVLTASTMSSLPLEEIATAGGPRWFQLYVHQDRGVTRGLIQRAEAAGYQALVLTVDLPVFGNRERDARNRFVLPKDRLGNFSAPTPEIRAQLLAGLHDQTLSWRDIDWMCAQSRLPLVLKGILSGEDAARGIEHGAKAIWVSNHGGRQLDQVPAGLVALPEVVAAVGGGAEVYLDGGVRRGVDVAIALCLGARAVFLARPFLFALALDGEAGVSHALGLLQREFSVAMALLGVNRVSEFGPQWLAR
jgi:4-hydroxymandelate oxidase